MKNASRLVLFTGTLLVTALAQATRLQTFGAGTIAFDVTSDGQTAAGTIGGTNFVWNAAGGMNTSIGGVAPGTGTGGYVRISGDGSTLLASGLNGLTGRYEPATYSFATGSWTLLGGLGGAASGLSGSAYDMTPDGRYVAGASYTGSTGSSFHAAIWDTATGTVSDISGGTQSRINGISDDGAVAVGYTGSGQTSAIWVRQGDGSYLKSAIIRPDGTTPLSFVQAVSGNGLWAAGSSFSTGLPYTYHVATGVAAYFPKLPYVSGNLRSVATPSAISDDGQTIIGTHSIQGTLDTNHGFIWNSGFGVIDLDDYFAGFGIDTGNLFSFVSPITTQFLADGSMTVLGIARDNTTSAMTGFMVNVPAPVPVPEPASGAMLLAGLPGVGFARRRLMREPAQA